MVKQPQQHQIKTKTVETPASTKRNKKPVKPVEPSPVVNVRRSARHCKKVEPEPEPEPKIEPEPEEEEQEEEEKPDEETLVEDGDDEEEEYEEEEDQESVDVESLTDKKSNDSDTVYRQELEHWSCVCLTLEDWNNICEKYKSSKKKCDVEIVKLLEANYLPEMPQLFQKAVCLAS